MVCLFQKKPASGNTVSGVVRKAGSNRPPAKSMRYFVLHHKNMRSLMLLQIYHMFYLCMIETWYILDLQSRMKQVKQFLAFSKKINYKAAYIFIIFPQ